MFKNRIVYKNPAEFVAVSEQRISAVEFMSIKTQRPNEIKNVKFVTPKIGSKDFGSFLVEYRTPKLVVAE